MLLRKVLRASFAVAAFGAAALAQTTTTSGTVTRTSSFPPVGLASSETAQINAANIASASAAGTPASCTGTLSFVNAAGATIGTAKPFTVTSGQIASLSVPYASVGGSGRTEVRGVITLTETIGSGVPCSLATSLETYDTSTGVTHVFYPSAGPGYGLGAQAGPGPGR
jgi:hypothetical protein